MVSDHKKIWEQYKKGTHYLRTSGLSDMWKECFDFFEGRQWPEPTNKTKNLPRPVINICKMIANNKKANVLNTKVKTIFKPAELLDNVEMAQNGADIFTKFADNIAKEMRQEDLDDKALGHGSKVGQYIYHYYWDKEVTGGMRTPYVGAMRGEILYPNSVIFANPKENDEQKQEYIIIATLEKVKTVEKITKANKINEPITADSEFLELEEDERVDKDEYCTVLTKYSRQNGKVIIEKSTKNCIIQKAKFLTPNINEIKVNFKDEDVEEISEPDEAIPQSAENNFKKELYPIVVGQWDFKENSIYGIGEIEQIRQNQKAINFNWGMFLLSMQKTGWPTVITKAGALKGQEITNEPGQVITDNTPPGSGDGIKFMQPPSFPSAISNASNELLNVTRSVTGSTEVSTGESFSANMAASAIIALQSQAKMPIDTIQKRFWRVREKIGKIWEQFLKTYYNDGRIFSHEEDGQTEAFKLNGAEYKDVDFNLSIDIGSGSTFSEPLIVTLLQELLNLQAINVDDYIDLYPDTAMPFKNKLKGIREKRIQEEMEKISQQQMGMISGTEQKGISNLEGLPQESLNPNIENMDKIPNKTKLAEAGLI